MKMPFPQHRSADDRRLIDYVLGLLPEAESEQLDEASIVDDEVAARLRAVEDDLVDAYVRGTLTGRTLHQFETHYMASPLRREKVAFARSLTRAVDRAAVAAPDPEVKAQRTAWKLLAVAAALLLACAALVLQTVRLGRGMSQAQQERQALDRRAQDLQQQVTDLRAAREPRATAVPDTKPQPAAPVDAPAIALVLLPQTRAVGPVPAVVLPARAQRIVFELRLDSTEPTTYQIALRDPAVNRIIWRSAWMAGSGSSLTVSLPAGILKPQHYSLDLFSRTSDADVVGSYAFEIASR